MRSFPALELIWPSEPTDEARDIALAVVDSEGPTAVELLPSGVRIFFRTENDVHRAKAEVQAAFPEITATVHLVPDENWAERSQAAITPVTVGRIRISPPWLAPANAQDAGTGGSREIHLTIQPSMGFGTGHHPSTRLCLALLQRHLSAGQTVLDAGTGSGLLAIAARRLGAGAVTAVDTDADALENAKENLELNGIADVTLRHADIGDADTRKATIDVALANLTGTLLIRAAHVLIGTVAPGGLLIASGYQRDERDDVTAAMAKAGGLKIDEEAEEHWIGAVFRRDND